MKSRKHEVSLDKLRWQCDPSQFDFECTKDLAPLREFIGQDRAVRAVQFGLAMDRSGYNIYVAGITGTGKTSMVKTHIEKLIKERGQSGAKFALDDWCYIYNFSDTDRPQIVSLPKGKGKGFRSQITDLLEKLKKDLGEAFSSDDYKASRKRLVDESQREQRRVFEELSEEARQQGFVLQLTPSGPALIPLHKGRPMETEEFLALDEASRKELESKRDELLSKLQSGFEKATDVGRLAAEKLQEADKEVGQFTVSRLFAGIINEYRGTEKISRYLADLKTYTLDNLELFKVSEEPVNPLFGVPNSQLLRGGRDPFLGFQVNVFVDNSTMDGPPVIVEANPNFGNLFGKIERRFLFGGYLSDHTMLKAGALSLANHGYLLLSARDVLTNPAVWPTLKRAIKDKEARIEDPFEQFGLIAPQGMRPEPMPIDVKIVLIGDATIYQMLSAYDEEFWELFRVKADFNFQVERTPENIRGYAAFIAGCCEECKAMPLDRTGVSRVIEFASRMVSDQDRLSTRFAQVKELVEESDYWAKQAGASRITAEHVQKAIEERVFRHNLADEQIRDMITRGTIMIDVEGTVVGQVNGLAVYSLGDISFGRPSRITAKTFMGKDGVINIERESQLSGRIHDKGVMILSGYLGWKYAQDKPLSLSASLCFEQSYEGVDGDSASSTELYAVLSSLSGVPVKQNIAVTGSVNQKGEVQPIGGVNQKIEGFFRVCRAKGLTGEQGVMIPHSNVKNLMLRDEVIDAVKAGKFHIYCVRSIDEGIEVLTGMEAGDRTEDGTYPEGTINYLVDKQLRDMAEKLRNFMATGEGAREEKKLARASRGVKRIR